MTVLEHLQQATGHLVRTVDGLDDDAWSAPSLLPGWTRAHVVAHLALNAEGLAAAVRGALDDAAVAIYASAEGRDADIEALAGAPASQVRDRLLGSATELADALEAAALAGDAAAQGLVERTPGSDRRFRVGEVPVRRWREVEVHHADLGAGHSPADWPEPFRVVLLDLHAPGSGATLVATDLGRTWQGGAQAPVVHGSSADLGWWLTGRGTGEGLTSDGELPRIEAR